MDLRCRDLAEFGLLLVVPDDPVFSGLIEDIEMRPVPGARIPPFAVDRAAVLLNQSGRAIVAIDVLWRYVSTDGSTSTSRCSTFGSSAQREVLMGRCKAGRDLGTFILPNSKRLITERGIFGNNLDVLTPEELPRAQGYCGGSGGGGGNRLSDQVSTIELSLDFMVLDDGLCLGADESGLFAQIQRGLDLQRETAAAAVAALHEGESEGRVFEMLRPLARSSLARGFASEAIHRLVHEDREQLLSWFEKEARPRTLELRRPQLM